MKLVAPFPWYGSKRRVAREVWHYLGTDAGRYIEPFAGSLAVLLARPHVVGVEIVNDLNGYIVNVWRALKHAPEETIGWADDLRSESDLTARHRWLVNEGAKRLREGLDNDPEWYDAQVAGWWLYGASQWIGDGWCRNGLAGQHWVYVQNPYLGNQGIYVEPDGLRTGRTISSHVYDLARALQHRLARVIVCNGDWKRVCDSKTALRTMRGHTAVYLDPPYEGFADTYTSQEVWDEVVDWCERQRDPNVRIVLSGYEGARAPRGWREIAYKARSAGTGEENRLRERFWVSPTCGGQLGLDEVGS
ncbi:MAG: hypothetical protein KatS3mg015_2471 [Fimbriimonadales bacterium]|nr:MAG: hypothetical protein KatS3mg015_2471 [Fimbriimonadales bacterium]